MPDVHEDPLSSDAERAELRRIADRLRPGDEAWEQPPAGLWERIAAEAGVAAAADPLGPPPAASTGDGHGGGGPATVTPGADGASRSDGGASSPAERRALPFPPDGARRRTRRSPVPWLLAAAAAVLVVVGAAIVVATRSSDTTVVALAPLERLGRSGSGDAQLVDHDGALQLKVTTRGVDAGGRGFLEVWVIDPQVRKLVSLGPVRADGVYDLPAGLQPRQFPIVDVSVEPFDGNPAHSTDSVLRGRLKF